MRSLNVISRSLMPFPIIDMFDKSVPRPFIEDLYNLATEAPQSLVVSNDMDNVNGKAVVVYRAVDGSVQTKTLDLVHKDYALSSLRVTVGRLKWGGLTTNWYKTVTPGFLHPFWTDGVKMYSADVDDRNIITGFTPTSIDPRFVKVDSASFSPETTRNVGDEYFFGFIDGKEEIPFFATKSDLSEWFIGNKIVATILPHETRQNLSEFFGDPSIVKNLDR